MCADASPRMLTATGVRGLTVEEDSKCDVDTVIHGEYVSIPMYRTTATYLKKGSCNSVRRAVYLNMVLTAQLTTRFDQLARCACRLVLCDFAFVCLCVYHGQLCICNYVI